MGGEPPSANARFLTVAEVATIMRVSKMTVYRLVHHGELESIRVGRSYRISEHAVNQYLRTAELARIGAYNVSQLVQEPSPETDNLRDLASRSTGARHSGPAVSAERETGARSGELPDGLGKQDQEDPAVSRFLAGQGDDVQIGIIPVSIYIADEYIHDRVERSVEQWLAAADVSIDEREDPVIGSWFRRLKASAKEVAGTPFAREAFLTGIHAADNRLTNYQDAYITATLLQNVGPLLQSLQPTKDAVIRAGALLIVKIDWAVQVHQLTAAQQAILDHRPQLVATSPRDIITALQLSEPVMEDAAVPPGDAASR